MSQHAIFYLTLLRTNTQNRINNEEQVLKEGLEGYKEYKEKVKYKVFPGVW